MNFLDPEKWKDLEGLEKEHEVLDEELVKQLHNRLRPYFLRRIKSEVLQLPPKVTFLFLCPSFSVDLMIPRTKSLFHYLWLHYKRRYTDLFSVSV